MVVLVWPKEASVDDNVKTKQLYLCDLRGAVKCINLGVIALSSKFIAICMPVCSIDDALLK